MPQHKTKFLVLVTCLLIAGFLITSFASFYVSRASLRAEIKATALPLTSDNVYSEIQRDLVQPVSISSFMANDTFLRDWVIDGEKNELKIQNYLSRIKTKYNATVSFFVSEKTRAYYHADGILKTVKQTEPRDAWYFRVRAMAKDYETNVDPDMANKDAITVFVNHKVYDYKGNYIGATGVGLAMNSIVDTIKKYQAKYNRNVYFTDPAGKIVLHALPDSESVSTLKTMRSFALPETPSTAHELLHTATMQGERIHLNARFIPEMGWYLIVEQSEASSLKEIYNTLLTNIAISLTMTLGLVLLINVILNAYRKTLTHLEEEGKKLRSFTKEQEKEIKTLSGLLPICSSCKKIRTKEGKWQSVESYLSEHTKANFSHGICPNCTDRLYPGLLDDPTSTQ